MALGPRLDLRQSQQLVMTPQLQQAIKLLALTNLEIEAFVTEELECNPLLEVQTEDDRGGDDGDPDRMAAGDGDADHDTDGFDDEPLTADRRSEEHTSELQSLMRNSYAVFCLKKKNTLTYIA